jgi:hypothetical protein
VCLGSGLIGTGGKYVGQACISVTSCFERICSLNFDHNETREHFLEIFAEKPGKVLDVFKRMF